MTLKKHRYLLPALLALLAVACSDPGQDLRQELCFQERVLTKGYVTGTTLYEGAVPRTMVVSAYLTPQSGAASNHFIGETFTFNGVDEHGENPVADDGNWHHNPMLFWPLGGSLDFLMYSSGMGFADLYVHWDPTNVANLVRLEVGKSHTQDDILYSSISGIVGQNTGGVANVTFRHAQAWIEIPCARTAGTAPVVVTQVVLENIYSEGDLLIYNNGGNADAVWSLRNYVSTDVTVEDPSGTVYGQELTDTPVSLQMLIPEQTQTAMVVYYTVAGEAFSARFELPAKGQTATWLLGNHYVYSLNFDSSSASVKLTCTLEPIAWDAD